jgi:hypothetical protein
VGLTRPSAAVQPQEVSWSSFQSEAEYTPGRDRVVPQAVSRWLPTAVARVRGRSQVIWDLWRTKRHRGRFPLPHFRPTAPHSSSPINIRGCYRPAVASVTMDQVPLHRRRKKMPRATVWLESSHNKMSPYKGQFVFVHPVLRVSILSITNTSARAGNHELNIINVQASIMETPETRRRPSLIICRGASRGSSRNA